MKTKKEYIAIILGSGINEEFVFPAGTPCRLAQNLPFGKDGEKKYWLRPNPSVKYTEAQIDWINRMGISADKSELF